MASTPGKSDSPLPPRESVFYRGGFSLGCVRSPGRFFAANELKAMLAYVLVHYDVRPEHDGVRPPNVCNGLTVSPDAHARVLFRKRQAD